MKAYNNSIKFLSLPHIREILDSVQFPYSERLVDLRYELDLHIEDLANIAELDVNYYVRLEYSDVTIPIEEYKEAINKIEKYKEVRQNP